jgi:hypothetical protein
MTAANPDDGSRTILPRGCLSSVSANASWTLGNG